MLYLGIDIGKSSHVASLLSEVGKVMFKAFSLQNTTPGVNKLLTKPNSYIESSCDVEFGMEATGHYRLSTESYLVKSDFSILVVNPLQTDSWRKGIEIR